jgi:hypothetical protein
VSTPDTITRAVLVRPAATTHALDMNQRHVDLKFTSAPGAITATAPVGGSAPAGWYMLFLLNGDGVPSVARFVKVIPT